MMIGSLGITLLALAVIVYTHHRANELIRKSYTKGYMDGAVSVLAKEYLRLEEFENGTTEEWESLKHKKRLTH